ncbi:MAG: AAA family ATPase [Bacilli bacterium]|nr:AAA family ATPase [Bacilli bacterium]
MTITKEELENEKKYLETVKKVLTKNIKSLKSSIEGKENYINEMKRFMWDNLSDYTDEERAIALSETDNSVDIANMSIESLSKYEKALKSPYFGKITFKEDNDDEEMKIYLGISSIQDGFEFYVFDWRAPISSLFYNYEVGRAKYDCPDGEITGEILSKMQFKIVDGNLLRCFKSNINIDDEYLQEILANASTDKMKNIVSTIQREQNLIIRNDSDKYLIVQGIAGSGKTSVALHRIAYLLYKDIKLTYNNVLILSPNDVFSDYISDVLPELGEHNVLKTTFSDFTSSFLKPCKNIENYSEFLERIYGTNRIDKEVIRYKMSDEYKDKINLFINEYENRIHFSSIKQSDIVVTKEEIQELFSSKYKKFPYKERIEYISNDICLRLHLPQKKYSNKVKKLILEKSNISFNSFDLYLEFINSDEFIKQHKCEFKKEKINYEDITPLLYIYFKINGFPNYSEIRQVVIDEVQDYTLFQMEILKSIFKNASFTVLGDINQTINPYYSYNSLKMLADIFTNCKYLELSKTYRSSEEIIEYSNRILDIDNACSVRKNNNIPVEIKKSTDKDIKENINSDIGLMHDNGIKRIAIITKDVYAAKKIYKKMNNEKIQLITSPTDSLNSELIIIPSYLSKGLEFDGVIVYNDSNTNYEEDEKRLYYVVCTRAQHQLSVYNEPSILRLGKN